MRQAFALALGIELLFIAFLSGCVQQETGTYVPPSTADIANQVLPEEPEPAFSCSDASMQFDSCSVTGGIARIGVYNNGIEDLNGFQVDVKYSDGSAEARLFSAEALDARDIGILQYAPPAGKKISSVAITSLQCPQLKATGSECYQ